MRLAIEEQETIIRWYRDETEATVYTSDQTMMTRYDKFVEGGDWKIAKTETHEGDLISKTYKAPKELLFGRKMKNKGLSLTDEEREARGARMRANKRNKS